MLSQLLHHLYLRTSLKMKEDNEVKEIGTLVVIYRDSPIYVYIVK